MMRRALAWFLAIAGLVSLGLSLVVTGARQAPLHTHWLIFVADGLYHDELYRMVVGERRRLPPQRLTHEAYGDRLQPAASPDGRTLAFTSDHEESYEIYTLSLTHPPKTSAGWRRLTHNLAFDGQAAWLPDGQSLLFYSDRYHEHGFYHMPARGESEREAWRLPLLADTYIWFPAPAPDGQSVLFQAHLDGQWALVSQPLGGGTPLFLSDRGAYDRKPVWSPDGAWLAFASDRDGPFSVYIMRPDGSDLRRLTPENRRMDYFDPAFSPDGRWLALWSSLRYTGEMRMYRVPVTGGPLERLTDYTTHNSPTWARFVSLPWRGGWLLGGAFVLVGLGGWLAAPKKSANF